VCHILGVSGRCFPPGRPPEYGIAEESEGCDGNGFRGDSCERRGFLGGSLRCTSDCDVDARGCRREQICGDGIADPYTGRSDGLRGLLPGGGWRGSGPSDSPVSVKSAVYGA
jgi:hypothetical protein